MSRKNWFVVLVTGSREYPMDYVVNNALNEQLDNYGDRLVVLEGGATGADQFAHAWAEENGVPCIKVDAQWGFYKKGAGPVRNSWMLSILDPDLCLAFPISTSKGTWDMVDKCRAANVETRVYDE